MEVSSPTGPFLKNKYGFGSQSSPYATCCHMDCFCQTPFSYSPGSPSFPTPPSPSPLSTLCLLQNPFPLPILPSLVPVLPPPSAPVSPFHPPRFPSLPEPSPPSLAPPLPSRTTLPCLALLVGWSVRHWQVWVLPCSLGMAKSKFRAFVSICIAGTLI